EAPLMDGLQTSNSVINAKRHSECTRPEYSKEESSLASPCQILREYTQNDALVFRRAHYREGRPGSNKAFFTAQSPWSTSKTHPPISSAAAQCCECECRRPPASRSKNSGASWHR